MFWIIVAISGVSIDALSLVMCCLIMIATLRLYVEFYETFTGQNIKFNALGDVEILSSMCVMWLVLLIDSLLKIAATKSSLGQDFDVKKSKLRVSKI